MDQIKQIRLEQQQRYMKSPEGIHNTKCDELLHFFTTLIYYEIVSIHQLNEIVNSIRTTINDSIESINYLEKNEEVLNLLSQFVCDITEQNIHFNFNEDPSASYACSNIKETLISIIESLKGDISAIKFDFINTDNDEIIARNLENDNANYNTYDDETFARSIQNENY